MPALDAKALGEVLPLTFDEALEALGFELLRLLEKGLAVLEQESFESHERVTHHPSTFRVLDTSIIVPCMDVLNQAGRYAKFGVAWQSFIDDPAPRVDSREKKLRKLLAMNVRKLRESKSLSLEEASHEGGLNWRHWQKVEAGEVGITLRTLVRLSVALDTEPHELLAPRLTEENGHRRPR